MHSQIGHIEAIYRYPVKSMAGEPLQTARLGFHGIEGDRRLALRRLQDQSNFPWLTAGKLPSLVLFTPQRPDDSVSDDLPTHIRTPEGELLPLFADALANDIAHRYGAPVQMMQLKHGIFDEASISLISTDTIHEIGRLAGISPDVRRFRPNILVRLLQPAPFQEDEWVGGVLSFGEAGAETNDTPVITVTMPDPRCAMLNIDPDTATLAPEMMKAAVRANRNNAGIYATVTRSGRLAVGQPILFHRRETY